jgi:hypothetical protein
VQPLPRGNHLTDAMKELAWWLVTLSNELGWLENEKCACLSFNLLSFAIGDCSGMIFDRSADLLVTTRSSSDLCVNLPLCALLGISNTTYTRDVDTIKPLQKQ